MSKCLPRALYSQQKASSAATFLQRVSVAEKLRKGKWEAAGRRKWSSSEESKQAAILHFMSSSRISPHVGDHLAHLLAVSSLPIFFHKTYTSCNSDSMYNTVQSVYVITSVYARHFSSVQNEVDA